MILIINCGSTKTPEIGKIVTELGYQNQIVTINNFNPDKDLKNINGLIISGAPILVTEVDTKPYLFQFNFLLTTNIPVLGICFGHQILGMVYGAIAMKCDEDRSWQDIDILKPSPLFIGFSNQISMREDHCECIAVPEQFIHTAKSIICENEAMQHQTKKLFGVQFHPEVSEEPGKQLISNFCDICQDENYQ